MKFCHSYLFVTFRRVQLKAFFHDKEDDSDTSNKNIFETLLVRKSKWTPPEG